jgi:hypothetical protein
MKKILKIAAGLFFFQLTIGIQASHAQQDRSAKELFNWWFDASCTIGQEDLTKMVENKGQELAPLFIQAYESGADKTWVDKRAEAEMKLVRANMEYIQKNKGQVAGLTKEEVESYQNMNLEEYEINFRANLSAGYQKMALQGLVHTKAPAAREYLTKIARNKREPNAETAQKLLNKMGQ